MVDQNSLSPATNILDSLERAAAELSEVEARGALALKGALAWSWHAVGLLFYLRVQPKSRSFDAWVQDYFHEWGAALDVETDARREERDHLGMLQILDLLSELDSHSLRPDFYAGWRDRVARCRELRSRVQAITGEGISQAEREKLLYLLGLANRLQHAPTEILVDVEEALGAFPPLLSLILRLWEPGWTGREQAEETVGKCLEVCRK